MASCRSFYSVVIGNRFVISTVATGFLFCFVLFFLKVCFASRVPSCLLWAGEIDGISKLRKSPRKNETEKKISIKAVKPPRYPYALSNRMRYFSYVLSLLLS